MTVNNKQLIKKLENACVVCRDCGLKYGVYSVGCSSVWEGVCNVCGETKPVTETRDYAYLMTGIRKLLKEDIKEQSKEVADYMLTQEPIMTDEDLDRVMNPSYLKGKIECWFTEEEVGFLNECLDTIGEFHSTIQSDEAGIIVPEDVALFESVEEKITELYQDHVVKYELSPAMKKYHELYGTFGFDNEVDTARWEGFRAGFNGGDKSVQ
jgi:hypothetical protein